jgi:hypothetical protein
MAARVRSDCRIARACARLRARPRGEIAATARRCRRNVKAGASTSPRVSTQGHIMVALTGRGRRQLHRLRGMSTRIRALVHEQPVDASTVIFW